MFGYRTPTSYHPLASETSIPLTNVEYPQWSSSASLERDNAKQYGQPDRKSRFTFLDTFSVGISLICFVAAILVVNPSQPFAFRLGISRQLIAIGFLLGAQNQCLQGVLPYTFILIEGRYGLSTLQNYNGLLKWSPFTSKLTFSWRLLLILQFALPLGLGVGYKQFIGGYASYSEPNSTALYAPTGPPGLQANVHSITVMTNATAPFMSASEDNISSQPNFSRPQIYGFNIVLLSNTSAVAMDAPVPERVTSIQHSLQFDSSVYLTADVRGTVVQYTHITDEQRSNPTYWDQYFDYTDWSMHELYNGYLLGMANIGVANNNDAVRWNGSWILIATTYTQGAGLNTTLDAMNMRQNAMRFDARRHACLATWRITRSSIELVSGDCDREPLPAKHQYYSNAQLAIVNGFSQILGEYLGPFATTRKQSAWLMPTHVVVLASIYQSKVSGQNGYIPIQVAGPIWSEFDLDTSTGFHERYSSNEVIDRRVSALHEHWTFYAILAIQPILTVAAYAIAITFYHVPIGRDFGLISMLAGVDRGTLDLLAGASLSGKLEKRLGLEINVKAMSSASGNAGVETIRYHIGRSGINGQVKHGKEYF